MKAVILAGGLGTRLSEETALKPKPMVEIGGKPIIWHIMKIYERFGVNDFIICVGYKGYVIKEYFANYINHQSDITVDLKNKAIEVHRKTQENWRITLIDTGQNTMTGGRLKRVANLLSDDEPFLLTYGDGVSDIDISLLIENHKKSKKSATVTAVRPPGRFGALEIDENGGVSRFIEKPLGDGNRINGGFFVLEKSVIKEITDDSTIWEREPLERLAAKGELNAYIHNGFWQPMDTLRDMNYLEDLIQNKKAPWIKE